MQSPATLVRFRRDDQPTSVPTHNNHVNISVPLLYSLEVRAPTSSRPGSSSESWPVLPFALSSLGFLTNFDFNDYKPLMDAAIDHGIRVDLRMRFTCTVYRAIADIETKKRKAVKERITGETHEGPRTRWVGGTRGGYPQTTAALAG